MVISHLIRYYITFPFRYRIPTINTTYRIAQLPVSSLFIM